MSQYNGQETDEVADLLNRTGQREEEAFQAFLRVWARTNPRPNVQMFSRWGAISIICLMLVAASSTGIAFAAMSYNELVQFFGAGPITDLLSWIVAVVAVVGIEGLIVTTGMKSGLKKSEDQLASKQFIAAFILLAVSCAANFYRPVGLLNDASVSNIVLWAISIAAGFGVPIAIYFVSPYLGMVINFQRTSDEEWLAKARHEFTASSDRVLARAELEAALRANKRAARAEVVHPSSEQLPPPQPQAQLPRASTADVVRWFCDRHKVTIQDPISATQVANEWYAENNITSANGDQTKLVTAVRTYLSRERSSN